MTDKRCPNCGDDKQVPLYSEDVKICPTCGLESDWKLDEGQKRTFEHVRGDEDYSEFKAGSGGKGKIIVDGDIEWITELVTFDQEVGDA